MSKIKSLNEITAVREYLSRIGAEARSLKTAVVREHSGKYWTDIAVIRFAKDGTVSSSTTEHAPTDAEQSAILHEWAKVDFPAMKMLNSRKNEPKAMREASPDDIFEFRTIDGKQIIMVQVRTEYTDPEGVVRKSYQPWTYWDDGQWRMSEPDGDLPIWGIDAIREHETVFIHEGARGARLCRWMTEGKTREAREALRAHPWGDALKNAAHIGWIGGALNPSRTDWSVLAKNGVKRAIIVADNDGEGKRAIPKIAQALKMTVMSIEFGDEFLTGHDLGDPFPEKMFRKIDGESFYVGPDMRSLTHPATWATDIIPNPSGTGRPITLLRESFKDLWAYVDEADVYVCREMPEIIRPESQFNKLVAGFSHVHDTARLLNKSYKGRSARLCYRPDLDGTTVEYRGSSAINLHTPSEVKSREGNPKPWLDFLEYMFVNPDERKEVERWCATLIARPEIRMGYGMLLISESQGIGKTTLGASILAPLVGPTNVGYPAEKDITSDFNDWVAHKRLAIVNEIYSGASWKAYHALKSVITDHDITVNQKYMRQYVLDNWCHVLACSNSMRALKMEQDDRRWFYPEVTEFAWPGEKFSEFRSWLSAGGINIIRGWAEEYGDYVRPNERAPMTARKMEMIEGSRSEAQAEAAALANLLVDLGRPGAILMRDVIAHVRESVQGRVFDTDYELRRAMKDVGAVPYRERIKVGGRLQYAIMNPKLADLVARTPEKGDARKAVRDATMRASELMESEL